ncbi:MAG: hypothetical protein Q8O58_00240 [Gallionella sp.]|nr:hypothetical protein [Gallionella sp.]
MPLYFLLISLSEGPKSDLSMLWQLKQLFFLANALNATASTAAFACPANINTVATAAMPTQCDFITPPQNNLIIHTTIFRQPGSGMTALAAKPGHKPATALFTLKIPRKFRKVCGAIVLR